MTPSNSSGCAPLLISSPRKDEHDNIPIPVISGRRANNRDLFNICVEMMCCFGCFILVFFVALFVCMCILLNTTNTENVRKACVGFWEFSLVALLSPILIPFVYGVYACCFVICFGWWNWYVYSGTCMFVMGVACLHMSIIVSQNSLCITALCESTPPVPWLLYAVWIKSVLFFSGSFSSLYYFFSMHRSLDKV